MTAGESSRTVRVLVIAVLSIATAGMVAVSMRANFLFGYGFGQSAETAYVFGWANVAADLWKVAGLIVIGALWRSRRRSLVVVLVPIWLLCLVWGLAGAVGVYAQDRTALIGGREAKVATYRDREHELTEIETKLQALKSPRSIEQVDAAIEAVLARPVVVADRARGTVGKLSANCTKSDRLTADVCHEVATLREERAAAVEAKGLEARRQELRRQVATLREGGAALAADPTGELFAWLSRGWLTVKDIGFGFPLFFAFLIEVVSAFGPAGIAAYADATRRDMARRSTPQRVATQAQEAEEGSVVSWLAECGVPTAENVAISIDELHADYEVWCVGRSYRAIAREAFGGEFDRVREVPELKGKIRKFGNRYYGLRLQPRVLLSSQAGP